MHNLMTDPLIRYRHSDGTLCEASLPEVYAALMADDVEAFPALRPHQRHAWHAFLVQLGAMAMHRDELADPPVSADEWRRIIRALTTDWPDDEPWRLVVDDITSPAFMQPPASSAERRQDFKNIVSTPDALDMLVTSKNHDLKAEVAGQASMDDWVFALVTLQTTEGFGGAGNYGISRMNSGFGNRSAFALAPSTLTPGGHVRRDIRALLEFLPGILSEHPGTDSGHTLLWTLPWDGGAAEALLLSRLHPLYLEVCRRIRLQAAEHGRVHAVRTSTKAARVEAKTLNGLTGDPWAMVDRRDKKGEKVLTLSAGGFHYKRVADYLTSGKFGSPALLRPTPEEQRSPDPMELVARAMVRGNGKTEGYHERVIAIGHKGPRAKSAMLGGASSQELGEIAKTHIQEIGKIQDVLRHSVATFAARGDSNRQTHRNGKPSPNDLAQLWVNRLDEIVDVSFFDNLQIEFEETDDIERKRIHEQWLQNGDRTGVIDHARSLLQDATDSLTVPAIHYYKAREAAEGLFEGRIRAGNGGFPDLFPDRDEEDRA